jgi:hypothetical protein
MRGAPANRNILVQVDGEGDPRGSFCKQFVLRARTRLALDLPGFEWELRLRPSWEEVAT